MTWPTASEPVEITTPPGAEGMEKLYRYSSLFSDDRRSTRIPSSGSVTGCTGPRSHPLGRHDLRVRIASLSQIQHPHYIIPPALGVDFRILNGYTYLTPVGVTNPARSRPGSRTSWTGGYYFVNWDRLYDAWLVKSEPWSRR